MTLTKDFDSMLHTPTQLILEMKSATMSRPIVDKTAHPNKR